MKYNSLAVMDKNPLKPDDMWKGASPQIFSNSKRLRENPTEAEEKLWLAVKDNQIEGNSLEGNIHLVYMLLIFNVML